MHRSQFALILATSAILVGCGGGGGSSSSTSGPITLSGHVIDGYIEGAIVCLDLNSNNSCDAGEPSTTSGPDGSYALPPYPGSIAGLQVIARVPVGARDLDTGTITEPYSMLAPAAASATVTPLSTLVVSAINSGGGAAQVTIGEALSAVSVQTGIPVQNLVAHDYKAKNDTTTGQVAAVTAQAIAQVIKTATNDSSIQAANLKEGEILKAALVQVKKDVLPQLIADGKATAAAVTNPQQAASKAIEVANIAGKVQDIIISTKAGDGSVVQMRELFREGIVVAQSDSGDYINSAGARVNGEWGGYTDALVAEFIQTANDKFPPWRNYVLVNDKWYRTYNDGYDYTFNGRIWEKSPSDEETVPDSLQPTFDQNCLSIPQNSQGTISQRFCAVQKDLSGRQMTEFITDLCKDSGAPGTCKTARFPSASYAYDLTQSITSNLSGTYPGLFQIWVSREWDGYCTRSGSSSCQSNAGTISDFINYTLVGNNNFNYQFIGAGCNVAYRFASYSPGTKTGVVNWTDNSSAKGCSNFDSSRAKVDETSSFQVISVGGKDVVLIPVPAIFRINNPGRDDPFIIFAAQQREDGVTGIWSGSYYPVDFKRLMPFTGNLAINAQILNKKAFDAILQQTGATPYPYDGRSSSGTYNGTKSAR